MNVGSSGPRAIPGVHLHKAMAKHSGRVVHLFVQDEAVRIVIEPNHVIRGTVFTTQV